MGADGSILLHNGHKLRISANGIVSVRDPTGAGDVMTCALTYMLSRGEDLEWSFIFSNAAAIAKTMGEGPYGVIGNDIISDIANKLFSRLIKT
ncbi:PfkB family carbohydrate kinase [Vulcanisaeta sp. JCM 16159]|uniref:PfkB family carbohydrate kinase n=1 Tax=Vulcanisaeta sp. JCM 16159 TaxID=1295371 RepID=UPI000B0B7C29|nr:PfkB family carbohydrate kinase [Vulcanisaeta sp. JCM 16159]